MSGLNCDIALGFKFEVLTVRYRCPGQAALAPGIPASIRLSEIKDQIRCPEDLLLAGSSFSMFRCELKVRRNSDALISVLRSIGRSPLTDLARRQCCCAWSLSMDHWRGV